MKLSYVTLVPTRWPLLRDGHLFKNSTINFNMALRHHEAQLSLAIEDLRTQEHPNYNRTAKKYSVARRTLRNRFTGKTLPIAQAHAESIQCLNKVQEETLINQINKLTDLKIPPTAQMTQNFAEEIVGRPIGKNWHARFIHRHRNRLNSLYIRNMDHMRQKAEYKPVFQLYFDLVCTVILCNNNSI